MSPQHDVVIVGGGPAGLSTALFLSHYRPALRDRLVVLEKAHYPREKYCGGAIGMRAERALREIGVHVEVPGATVSRMSVALEGGSFLSRYASGGRVIRRIEYDNRLAEIARSRGIRIIEGVKVNGIARDDQGVTLDTSQGELRSRVVIGADGVGSVVRKSLEIQPGTWRAQVLEVDTEEAPGDLPRDILHFDLSDRSFDGYEWDFPTVVDGQAMRCKGVYHLLLPGQSGHKVDLTKRLAKRLAKDGQDLSKYKKKRYAERGFAAHEALAAPRVILVGEAAGIDPITGEGIAQALLYGRAVAPYVLSKLDRDVLNFRDWKLALSRSDVGVDLHVRSLICRLYFSPARRALERWFLDNPEAMEQGVRHFGGDHVEKRVLLRLLGRGVRDVARERPNPLERLKRSA